MASEPIDSTPPREIVHPLTRVEVALVASLTTQRERERQRLELEFQRFLAELNKQLEPVLAAHGVVQGDSFEIRDDATAATGVVLAVRKSGNQPIDSKAAAIPLNRGARRRLQKGIGAAVRKGGRR